MGLIYNRWKHLKTDNIYEIVGFAIDENSMVPVVLYKSVGEEGMWTRPCSQFFDGRFQQAPQPVKGRPQKVQRVGDVPEEDIDWFVEAAKKARDSRQEATDEFLGAAEEARVVRRDTTTG